jgi:glucosamine--fructose-6-phosphate aminotransferase (isomerizing)
VTRVSPSEAAALGAALRAEIGEQPAALRGLLAHKKTYAEVAEKMRGRALVRMVGHGSSDNAASYGVYAFGILAGLTAMRDSISLTVYSRAELDMTQSAVIGLSQSGQTPDVVEYVQRARERGAFTIALTNSVESELALAAEAVLPLAAGEERSIAATKTYSNQLAALALLAAGCSGRDDEYAAGIAGVADLLDATIPWIEPRVAEIAVAFAYVGRMFVIGRGAEFATAREISLKLLETCRVAAEPLTATDLAHGPVAALDALFPVWAIASRDENLPAVREAVLRARSAGAAIVSTGPAAAELDGAYELLTPEAPLPLLSPLVSVIPGQLFALALARAKGLDPDKPAGLAKVTVAP